MGPVYILVAVSEMLPAQNVRYLTGPYQAHPHPLPLWKSFFRPLLRL